MAQAKRLFLFTVPYKKALFRPTPKIFTYFITCLKNK